ncbi:MAG: hypothetical protein PHX13_07770 [Thiovulaceae bacterium]|nr:hypothetical protein [Sulfurimonadaceae bacterium]
MKNVNLFIKENIQKIAKNDLYIFPNIPNGKLKNAIKAFHCESFHKSILAIYDTTLLGSAKEGLVFTGEKILYNNGELIEFPYKDITSIEYKKDTTVSNSGKESTEHYILIMMNSKEYILKALGTFNYQEFSNILNKIIKDFDNFYEENQGSLELHEFIEMSEIIKIAYVKIIINMAYFDDKNINQNELAEIFLLMTRLEFSKESRFEIKNYISDIVNVIEHTENLILIIKTHCEISDFKSIKLFLIKDLINIYLSTTNDKECSNFKFLYQNTSVWELTNKEIEFTIETVKLDHKILKENLTDDMVDTQLKALSAKAESLGIPKPVLYISGGLSVLLLPGIAGLSLLSVATYKGVRYFSGDNELDKYKKREILLQDVIKQSQRTISLIIDDMNFIVEKLNEVITEHNEQGEKIQKLLSIMSSFQGALQAVDNKSNAYDRTLAQLKCPDVIDIQKIKSLTSKPEQQVIFDFIIENYEENLKEPNKYTLKENLTTDTLDKLSQIFESIEYLRVENMTENKSSVRANSVSEVTSEGIVKMREIENTVKNKSSEYMDSIGDATSEGFKKIKGFFG